jgi:hypothetical protein
MTTLWKFTKIALALILCGLITWGVLSNYSILFSKTIVGEVIGVERVELPVALLAKSGADISSQVFSFAIAIKDPKLGEIYTASSEDRQWAVVQKGQCAEAVYLPYPPWNFNKKGTYFGARLIRLFECPK